MRRNEGRKRGGKGGEGRKGGRGKRKGERVREGVWEKWAWREEGRGET